MISMTLGLGTGTALAAAPEEPVSREAKSITAGSAVLNGELNPKAADLESEEYEFAYRQSGSECLNEGAPEKVVPEPPEPPETALGCTDLRIVISIDHSGRN